MRRRELSRKIVATNGSLAVALLSIITTGADFASAAPKEVVVRRKNVSTSSDGLGLEEFKKKLILTVKASQARLFRMKNQIVRTSVADPGIAEPVVFAANQLCIRGNAPGTTTITLWDDVGAAIHMEVRVENKHGLLNSTMAAFHNDIDQRLLSSGELEALSPAVPAEITLEECEAVKHSHYHKQHEDSTTTASRPATPIKLPREDFISFTFGENEGGRVLIRSGFKCENSRPTKTIDLIQSQARVFLSKNGLASTTISDPGVAEPVVVSKRAFVLMGKCRGKSVLVLNDDLGNEEVLDLRVHKASSRLGSTLNALRSTFMKRILHVKPFSPIPPTSNQTLALVEIVPTKNIELQPSHPRLFKTPNSIVRTAVSDPSIAEPVVVSSAEIAMLGSKPGKTTLFIWDDTGKVSGITLNVTGKPAAISQFAADSDSYIHSENPSCSLEVECWSGSKKDVFAVPDTSIDSKSDDAPILPATAFNYLPVPNHPDRVAAIYLNNDGVKALAARNFKLAIKKLQAAVKVAPSYHRARSNLAIAYNNFALTLVDNPLQSISQFHNAVYLDPTNETTVANLEGMIGRTGRTPNNFDDRVELGDYARKHHDTVGSIVEYRAALALREDPEVRAKLDDMTSRIDRY